VSLVTGQVSGLQVLEPAQPPKTLGGEVPPWVFAMLGPAAAEAAASGWRAEGEIFLLRRLEGSTKTLWSLRVPGALGLDAESFERACAEAYRILGGRVSASRRPFAVRWWNFIPGILEPLGALEHRYMVFNAGRFQALEDAGGTGFGRLATASGVGHDGPDFVLHCLSARAAGRQIENPRQIPAWRYSLRYGPKPPCFARATRIERGRRSWLLVGGTASVRGEESFHAGDLYGQLEETLRNLAALVESAEAREPAAGSPEAGGDGGRVMPAAELERLLGRYRQLRVYHARREQGGEIEDELRRRLGSEVLLEMVAADLCRPELLVEIEGLAELEA
jgi:chorismate lyase/3-hydroxybenzoate synthase